MCEVAFDMSVFALVADRPVYDELDDLPSTEELQRAIRCLRNHKAAGASAILPEMVKCGGAAFREGFLSLIRKVWEEGSLPQAWKDANLVPIPKKGDLSLCDNWRGIALLDVAGKVVVRLVQNRLQQIAEQELPDSQCGFRRGRSCTDQIFSLLQITEKLYEHTAHLISYCSLTFARRMIRFLKRLCGEACNVLVYHPNW